MIKQPTKRYSQMNLQELREATAIFDREFIADEFRPLTKADREKHRQAAAHAKAQRGRPPIGEGAQRVLVTIERGLLREADRAARDRKISRSRLIAEALRERLKRSA